MLTDITPPPSGQIFIQKNFPGSQLYDAKVLQNSIGVDALDEFGIAELQVVFQKLNSYASLHRKPGLTT